MSAIIRVGAMYLHNEGKILMLCNKNSGLWFPPGGKAKDNELLHEAAVRETYEETGIEVVFPFVEIEGEKTAMLPRPQWMQMEAENDTVCEAAVYLVDVESREYTPNEESTDSGWFTPEEAMALKPMLKLIHRTLQELKDQLDFNALAKASKLQAARCSQHGLNYRNWCFECGEKKSTQ